MMNPTDINNICCQQLMNCHMDAEMYPTPWIVITSVIPWLFKPGTIISVVPLIYDQAAAKYSHHQEL